MQEHDARILRGAAIPTAIVGVIAMVVALAVGGVHALIGAAVGTVVVIAFFGISFVAVSKAGQRSATLMFPVAMGTYTLKILVLGLFLVLVRDSGIFDVTVFAITVGACAVVWLGGHMRGLMTDRRPIVEPAESEPESAADERP